MVKYGKWIVLRDAPDSPYKTKKGYIVNVKYVLCVCQCGTQKEVKLGNLHSGGSKQCVKCQHEKVSEALRKYDLKEMYGDWTPLYRYKTIRHDLYCLCRCKCGHMKYVRCGALKDGTKTECIACSNFKRRKIIDKGKKYGKWTTIEESTTKNRKSSVLCECACGRVYRVLVCSLKNGKSTKCRYCAKRKENK